MLSRYLVCSSRGALKCRERISRVTVIGFEFQGSAQFLLRFVNIAGAAIEQSEVLV